MSSKCTLSDSLNLLVRTYDFVNNLLVKDPGNKNIDTYFDSIYIFLEKILDNSTPFYWSDEELDTIIEMAEELEIKHENFSQD